MAALKALPSAGTDPTLSLVRILNNRSTPP
jgi:hypothetical protein